MDDATLETLSVAEIMLMCPSTIRLFIEWRLHCVGCPIAPFHTLADVAREHGVDADQLTAAVAIVINGQIKDVRA
jgi:hybrid cluster-associated redox disulfide protein